MTLRAWWTNEPRGGTPFKTLVTEASAFRAISHQTAMPNCMRSCINFGIVGATPSNQTRIAMCLAEDSVTIMPELQTILPYRGWRTNDGEGQALALR